MKVAVIKERFPGEHRVALVPTVVGALVKSDHDVLVESDAGLAAGFSDTDYEQAGGTIVSRDDAFEADCILTIRACGAAGETWESDRKRMSKKSVIIGMVDPLGDVQACLEDAKTGATIYALELVPRITRAQSMDVLSSQANIAGYEAVLLGATALKKILPMMTTAAGTIRPAKALILGAGVAGLQAIATAKRLGAQVLAYDVRPAVKEQVESLGAKFVELDLETQSSETKGGYAKAMTDEFYKKQQELLGKVISECDLVVTTALIPGKPAPRRGYIRARDRVARRRQRLPGGGTQIGGPGVCRRPGQGCPGHNRGGPTWAGRCLGPSAWSRRDRGALALRLYSIP
ncbi:MAG: NAD(P) transhydrogenase subunit alpha, partial [Pirellulales bacterium]|nr:NAD(P) transhydrogenase subunit alpha [Pirellulales bacterium]